MATAPNKFKVPISFGIDPGQLQELVNRLRDLDKKAARAAVRKGMGDVTKPVNKDAKANVPKRTGTLRKSIGRKVFVTRGGAQVFGVVKPRGGEKYAPIISGRKINPIKYAHLVEYGRVSVKIKDKKVLVAGGAKFLGKTVKAVAPRPFLRPAWDKNKGNATAIMQAAIQKAIKAWWEKKRSAAPKAKRRLKR